MQLIRQEQFIFQGRDIRHAEHGLPCDWHEVQVWADNLGSEFQDDVIGGDGVMDKTDKFWAENHFLARQRYEKLAAQRLQSLNVWKQAAKKWRVKALDNYNYYEAEHEARRRDRTTATRRKELLRRARTTLEILQDHHCAGIHEDHNEVMDMVNKLDREIEKELADD